jgi:hypothetical protein
LASSVDRESDCPSAYSTAGSLCSSMLLILQVVTVFLVGVAMSMALAHALEFPGKLRLDEQTYLTVQTIYYPGFTVGGIGEALAVIATLVLALAMRDDGAAFWWALSAFIAVLAMHVIFWLITQPTNRYWLRNQQMRDAGNKFFGVDRSNRSESTTAATPEWQRLRNRWEYSHIVRAVLSSIALVAVVISLAI